MKRIIKGCLKIDIIVFAFVAILPDTFVRYFCQLGLGKLPTVFNYYYIFLACAILAFLPKKARKIIEVILTSISSIYCFVQVVHYKFFSTFYSLNKLTVINELTKVSDEALSKVEASHAVFLLPILIIVLVCIFYKAEEKNLVSSAIIFVIAIVLSFGCYKISINKIKSTRSDSWLTDAYLYDSFHNKTRYFFRFGQYQFITKDIQFIIQKDSSVEEISEEEKKDIQEFIDERNDVSVNEMTGIYKDKNLIVILAESLNIRDVDEEIMPNLYRLFNSGYFFDNYYAPIYQSATGDTEFISQTSMIPSVDFGTTSYTYYNNAYPYSLANTLKDIGFVPNSYHSYISNFYNREMFHDSLGFNTFYDMDKLKLQRDEDGYIEAFNWIEDERLFTATIENTDLNEQFYDFIITVSGHIPYVTGRKELEGNLYKLNTTEKYADYDDESKSYLAAQMNLDKGIGKLLEMLEAEGKLDDTIIVLFGDHYPYGLTTDEGYDKIVGADDYTQNKVPFVIYDSTLNESHTISTLGSTFDILPTIYNLFGIETEGYVVGKDLFDSQGHKVIFSDRSVLTDNFYYNANTGDITEFNENIDDIDDILNEVSEIFDYGQKILTTDYYNYD